MTTPYTLPEPTPCGYISGTEYFYTAEQMHAAFTAGAASRDAEVDALRADALRLTCERDYWADRWTAMRKQYAELRYPGMTNEVRASSAAIAAEGKTP